MILFESVAEVDSPMYYSLPCDEALLDDDDDARARPGSAVESPEWFGVHVIIWRISRDSCPDDEDCRSRSSIQDHVMSPGRARPSPSHCFPACKHVRA